METIRGRKSLELDLNGLTNRLASYSHILLDLGTGDGRYVHCLAERNPSWFIIGVDACRENLRANSQRKLPNALFVIANAQALPRELNGLISHVTINFPWGSLLESLLSGEPALMNGLSSISCLNAGIEIHLNSGALAEAGKTLETGAEKIYSNMLQAGWQVNAPVAMNTSALRNFPSTWAKRLAFGRDPRAIHLSVQKE
jgi:16S rRNA (adenine(1408)-N(1))-methyltransferase